MSEPISRSRSPRCRRRHGVASPICAAPCRRRAPGALDELAVRSPPPGRDRGSSPVQERRRLDAPAARCGSIHRTGRRPRGSRPRSRAFLRCRKPGAGSDSGGEDGIQRPRFEAAQPVDGGGCIQPGTHRVAGRRDLVDRPRGREADDPRDGVRARIDPGDGARALQTALAFEATPDHSPRPEIRILARTRPLEDSLTTPWTSETHADPNAQRTSYGPLPTAITRRSTTSAGRPAAVVASDPSVQPATRPATAVSTESSARACVTFTWPLEGSCAHYGGELAPRP
jgi:hypothetical protein